jgi:hypothetical protein
MIFIDIQFITVITFVIIYANLLAFIFAIIVVIIIIKIIIKVVIVIAIIIKTFIKSFVNFLDIFTIITMFFIIHTIFKDCYFIIKIATNSKKKLTINSKNHSTN